ncbi:CAP domain-containing protein [Deinococcus sp. 12RED42]|uniref:CAP domain-containing protein n=1 Tax=Deinococcus sp. 12RED42 TaxID=2745872 RepID=UPI001E3171DA|nr:CAP domain-containing protein [Deinococcus sp. 12RED42]MCD0167068.1 CAP domain-containing protein [Deinococcus sp. 12RED42]
MKLIGWGAGAVVAVALVACDPGPSAPSDGNGGNAGDELVTVTVTDASYNVTFDYKTTKSFSVSRSALPGFPQSQAEREMLEAINAERARGGVCPSGVFPAAAPLKFEGHLHKAATLYGRELAASGRLDLPHRSQVDNRVPSQRMVDAGYRPVPPNGIEWVFGESLAAGMDLTSPAEVIAAWKGSPSHCAALFEKVLDGTAAQVTGAAGTYWVLNIAGW